MLTVKDQFFEREDVLSVSKDLVEGTYQIVVRSDTRGIVRVPFVSEEARETEWERIRQLPGKYIYDPIK